MRYLPPRAIRSWTSSRTLLESSPLLALFLAIASGYALGQLSIAGVSFGAGAILLVQVLLTP